MSDPTRWNYIKDPLVRKRLVELESHFNQFGNNTANPAYRTSTRKDVEAEIESWQKAEEIIKAKEKQLKELPADQFDDRQNLEREIQLLKPKIPQILEAIAAYRTLLQEWPKR